jgi:hypothetical protein
MYHLVILYEFKIYNKSMLVTKTKTKNIKNNALLESKVKQAL